MPYYDKEEETSSLPTPAISSNDWKYPPFQEPPFASSSAYSSSFPLTTAAMNSWNAPSSYSGGGSSTFSVSVPPSSILVDYEHIRQIIREELVAYFEEGHDVLATTVPLERDDDYKPGTCDYEEEETLS